MNTPLPNKNSTPPAPLQDAPPSEVQSYFSNLLSDLHGVPVKEATEISSRWKYGRGSEVMYYDVETYRAIFGAEVGTVLFGHGRRELRLGRRGPSKGVGRVDERERERPARDIFGLTPGATPLYLFFLLSAAMTYQAVVTGSEGMGIGAGLATVGFVASYWIFYFS